jgi:CBS domain-containing protein
VRPTYLLPNGLTKSCVLAYEEREFFKQDKIFPPESYKAPVRSKLGINCLFRRMEKGLFKKMKVQDIMTTATRACHASSNLAEAAMIMWENDCGIVPVLDGDSKVVGLITDRDICIASATKNRAPGDIQVMELITGNIASCKADDDIKTALKKMEDMRIRRLPVVSEDGSLQGILSISDIVQSAEDSKKKDAISYKDVVSTLKAICSTEIIPATSQSQPQQQPEVKAPKKRSTSKNINTSANASAI